MRSLIHTINRNPSFDRLTEWGRVIAVSGFAQSLIQGLSLISGILVIRLLPAQEYAWYTLANTVLGIMIALADGGIYTAVMAEGGKVWKDPEKLGAVLVTGFLLRRQFSVLTCGVAIPVLLLQLHHMGASWLISALMTSSVLFAFVLTLRGHLLEVVPKLQQEITSLQRIQVVNSLGRLTLVAPILFFFPWAYIAVLAAGLPQFWTNNRLLRLSSSSIRWDMSSDSVARRNILSFVKLSLPTILYFSFSSQIMIWLISFFGSTRSLAQIGALSRLALLLTVISTLFSVLIAPRFARLPLDHTLIRNRFCQMHVILVGISACVIGVVYMLPSPILWVLGKQYADLGTELLLTIVGSCLVMIVNITIMLYNSRGWILKPQISIFINISSIVAGAFLFDVTTIQGVLLFNIFLALSGAFTHFIFGLYCINKYV